MMDQPFIVTKEHRRFTEFANAVRKERTIGICHGDAGVGKTYSARRYANWDALEPYITDWRARDAEEDAKHFSLANKTRAVFYTPEVLCRPKELMAEIHRSQVRIASCIDGHLHRNDPTTPRVMNGITKLVALLIIDEAERLTPTALELLRDNHDRTQLGIILIGMPGIDQRFRHYPQLYSRLGFSHRYRPLGREELLFVLDRHWKRIGRSLDPDDFTDAQAIAAIERITRGNFRLLERLFPQITRVLKINQLETITDDVIEAAASTLVIGN